MTLLIPLLSRQTGLPETLVRQIIVSAPRRYKTYHIPKRSGGVREISQPAREVKKLQRAFMQTVLEKFPVHPAATAYQTGKSILDNARPHQLNGPILKMDFQDFFPSIKPVDWQRFCAKHNTFVDKEDIIFSSSLLFFRPKNQPSLRLAIGAPSSPLLSNVLMFEFDRIISETVSVDKIIYTRYADDLTFSAKRTGFLVNVIKNVRKIVAQMESPNLKIREDKTIYVTRKYHRVVTGLTLANDGRVTISREKKRDTFSRVHAARYGKLNDADLGSLCGYLAFINSVEPNFLLVLRRKYGTDTIHSLQHKIFVKKN